MLSTIPFLDTQLLLSSLFSTPTSRPVLLITGMYLKQEHRHLPFLSSSPWISVAFRPLYLPLRVLFTAESFSLSSNIIVDTATLHLRYGPPNMNPTILYSFMLFMYHHSKCRFQSFEHLTYKGFWFLFFFSNPHQIHLGWFCSLPLWQMWHGRGGLEERYQCRKW